MIQPRASFVLRRSCVALALSLPLVACSTKSTSGGDEKSGSVQSASPASAPSTSASATLAAGSKGKEADGKEKKPVLGCDQRDWAPSYPGAKPKRICFDYTTRKAGIGSASCVQGIPLTESGCPTDGVVAKCVSETTGNQQFVYKGANIASEKRMCETANGKFEVATATK